MTPASRSRNSVGRVREHERQVQPLEPLADLRGFVQPQDAVVHEDARQPVADRAMNDQRRDRRIDAAAQAADHAAVADLRADPRRRLLDKRRHRPVARAAADAVREVAEDLEAALGVDDFRMKQRSRRAAATRRPSPRPARWRSSRRPKTRLARRRRSRRGSPRRGSRRARPQRARLIRPALPRWIDHRDRRGRTRAAPPARPAAERVGHQLHAVADAEHRTCRGRRRPDRTSARPASETLFGPPDRMMPAGRCARIRSSGVSGGQISEYTESSRRRRAMSCVYCEPKSRTMMV